MFGGLGILAGSVRSWACIPLSIRLHDGLQAALAFGDCLFLLDRYFLTVPALEKLKALNSSGDIRMEIVTKAKKSCTGENGWHPEYPGKH